MRFITEFELVAHKDAVDAYKANGVWNLGIQIRDAFGWKEEGFLKTDGLMGLRHTLEIEAFPMDKWIEFKRDLFAFLELDSLQYKTLLDRISELESFGKPAGNTI